MIKTRKGVFETNSSSSHSISLSDTTDLLPQPFSDAETNCGIAEVYYGEFGWEIDTHNDVSTKLSYLYTDIGRSLQAGSNPNMITDNEHLNLIRDAVKYHTGLEVHFEEYPDIFPGYIDHQSSGTCADVWDGGIIGVVNFVFNPDSVLKTDNDNH